MEQTKNRYLLTGGGTGGHVYPAIAIADELRRREPEAEFLYVGVKGKAEEKIVPARGYPLSFVTSRGWPGARPGLTLLRFAFALGWGVLKAALLLRRFRPTLIIATGGYVSAPIMLAWVILKRLKMTDSRAFVHEQNLVPGRLNRLVGRLADRVGVSFEESIRCFPNAMWVGYPVRKEMNQESKAEARRALDLPEDAKVLLAFGGSLGSRSINRAIVDALPLLLQDPKLHVIHGVGRYHGAGYNPLQDTEQRLAGLTLKPAQRERYHMHEYLDPIDRYYAAADVVVCRAGAGSLTEIALCGLPALIVPKANLPGDHQVRNAQALSNKGAGQILYEQTRQSSEGLIEMVEGEALASAAKALLDDADARKAMSAAMADIADADALERIVDAVQQIARGGPLPDISTAPPKQNDRPEFSEFSGAALVGYLSRHGCEGLTKEERAYLAYRTEGYLASPAWQTRNVGVKLLGLLKLQERLDLLLYILQDKTPAPWWHRLLGGDLKQVGFIRRNALVSLRQIGVWNEKVRETLLAALADNYFEARSAAARTTAHFHAHTHSDQAFLQALDACTDDRSFEVAREAIRTLGQIDTRPETYERFKRFFEHPNWRIREAIVYALKCFVKRGLISPTQIEKDLDLLLVTSSGFVPHFQLREQIRQLSQALKQARESECSTA